jgi:8-oxo-dGTP pyrophosphatase MutT (NUDIX family)
MTDDARDPFADPWTTLSSRVAYSNPWIEVEERQVLTPAGTPGLYGIVRFRKLAIGVLPIEPDGTVWLVGQWRPPLDLYSWEMPEGGGDKDVAPEESARRELKEETGLDAGHLREVLRMHLSNSVCDEAAICYIATQLTQGEAAPEETEQLSIRRTPFRQALQEALEGAITDSLTVATLLRAHHMAVTGGLEPALARAMLGEEGA